ncbi:MAG TPA: hypothetical protein VFV67_34030 [Actinophytocola sp.]|uniref:hypothetical protein n=1 Tax=Actinophytocola sp. TaxID=1872138 RepID=UPI002DB5806C|nr:hypothetical protein [Actinophytocola sp.]HEU5475687.1 hypothetical protein [Actinophytocola sp.]
MGSRRRYRPRPAMDGVMAFDRAGQPIHPVACRNGHPLGESDRTPEIDWFEYLCRACQAASVGDFYFRLQRPIAPLTHGPI